MHELAPEPKVENQVVEPGIIPPTLRKSNRNLWIIACGVIGVICICSVICAVIFGVSMFRVGVEKAPVESVLDAYMHSMANKDAESAYALFSPRAHRLLPISKIQDLLEGNNYIVFEGYQSLTVSNLNISAVVNTNPDVPQGTVAKVSGVVNFEGGIQGSFNGTLEKVDDKWMLDGVFVTVPPDKIK